MNNKMTLSPSRQSILDIMQAQPCVQWTVPKLAAYTGRRLESIYTTVSRMEINGELVFDHQTGQIFI